MLKCAEKNWDFFSLFWHCPFFDRNKKDYSLVRIKETLAIFIRDVKVI